MYILVNIIKVFKWYFFNVDTDIQICTNILLFVKIATPLRNHSSELKVTTTVNYGIVLK